MTTNLRRIGCRRVCPARRDVMAGASTWSARSGRGIAAVATIASAAAGSTRLPPSSEARLLISISRSIGLVRNRLHPASIIWASNPAIAFAVSATIGTLTPRALRVRIVAVDEDDLPPLTLQEVILIHS